MSIDDQTLMAFADGELAAARASEVAQAVTADPALAARVARFRAVRTKLAGSLDDTTPAPDLLDRARQAQAAQVRGRRAAWGGAIAAGLGGLLIGGGAMSWLQPSGQMTPRGLQAALETTASGATRARITPVYTVIAADGRPCRAFKTAQSDQRFEGVACRGEGGWRLVALAAAETRPAGYAQAGSDEPPAVAAAVDALKPGDPLPAAAEQALIRRGWRE